MAGGKILPKEAGTLARYTGIVFQFGTLLILRRHIVLVSPARLHCTDTVFCLRHFPLTCENGRNTVLDGNIASDLSYTLTS